MTDRLVAANISRDELAIWLVEGVGGVRVPKHISTAQAVADVIADPAVDWPAFQSAADHVLARLAAKFQETRQ